MAAAREGRAHEMLHRLCHHETQGQTGRGDLRLGENDRRLPPRTTCSAWRDWCLPRWPANANMAGEPRATAVRLRPTLQLITNPYPSDCASLSQPPEPSQTRASSKPI